MNKMLIFKRLILIFGLANISAFIAVPCSSIVGKKAPNFKAQAVVDGQIKEISLSDFEGKNKVLIFYPADFSFICPTELFAFQEQKPEFEKRNTVLIAFSVDQIYSHEKWLNTPKKEGGVKGITYPIASDITKKISSTYMTLDDKQQIDLRGIFIIDTNNIIQAASIYNMSVGRSTDEVLRVLDAVLFTQEHGQVCPANWKKGKKGLDATPEGVKKYLTEESK